MRTCRRASWRVIASRSCCCRRACASGLPEDHLAFRQRHETALAGLFGEVLALCAEAGLVKVGLVAIDGTKVHANASQHATRSYGDIAREILGEADAVDAADDEQFGERRGDELPPELASAQGRRGWLREAKRRLDERRAEEARPIPRSRPDRHKEAKRRLEEEHAIECRANADYEAYRTRGRMKDGRRFGRPPNPYERPQRRRARSTSPTRTRATSRRRGAGCRATTRRLSAPSNRPSSLGDRRQSGLWASWADGHRHADRARGGGDRGPAGGGSRGRRLLAPGADERLTGSGTVVLIPPDAGKRKGARPRWDGGFYAFRGRYGRVPSARGPSGPVASEPGIPPHRSLSAERRPSCVIQPRSSRTAQ
jgi:hypothetical protein